MYLRSLTEAHITNASKKSSFTPSCTRNEQMAEDRAGSLSTSLGKFLHTGTLFVVVRYMC